MAEEVYAATGRRKAAVARVRLTHGDGTQVINGRPVHEYLGRESLILMLNQPFEVVDGAGKYNVTATVHGGGVSGQTGAIRLGIARALILLVPTWPSFVARPERFSALAMPAVRSESTAFSTSPLVSSSAFLQAIMPAPVLSRNSLTNCALTAMPSHSSLSRAPQASAATGSGRLIVASITESAMIRIIRLTALIASSLLGIG